MIKTIPEIDDAKDFIRDAMDKARRKMDRDAWNAFVAEVTKPPTEPEIEVTETMAEAGWSASCEGYNSAIERNAAVYRAMVKAAPGGIPHAINSVTII